jgi:hypothetical protein
LPLVEHELQAIGIRHVRDGIHLQNSDYNKMLYGRWVQLGKSGIRFDGVLDPRSNLGPLTAALLDQVDQLTGHSLEYFEGPNELDVSNFQNWSFVDQSFQKTLYDSVVAMTDRSSIRVIGPSMALASNGPQVGNIADCIDHGNLHPYPSAQMPSIVFPEQIDLGMKVSGSKTIVFTESGYHNGLNDHSDQPAVTESAAAKYIPRLFLEDYARGIPLTYLYEFLDEAPDPKLTHFQLHWGLVRADGSEKPAYSALRNLIADLSDDREPVHLERLAWSLDTSDPRIHHLLLQFVEAALTLGQQAKRIALYEPSVQSQSLHVYTNVTQVHIDIPDHPLVIKIWFQ